MKQRHYIGGAIASIALITGVGVAVQDHESGGPPMDEAMMTAWKDYATPGPGQAKLAERQGLWNVRIQQWMAPGTPVEVSEGRSQFRMELGGRFLIQVYESEYNGESFRGLGLSGFNNKTQQMQFNWCDNMSTGMMQGSGVMKGDVLVWTATATNPLTGEYEIRGTETFDDPNRFRAEMYAKTPDGSEFKAMQLDYVRVGEVGHEHGDHDHDHAHEGHDHDHDHDHEHGDHDHR